LILGIGCFKQLNYTILSKKIHSIFLQKKIPPQITGLLVTEY